MNLCLTAANASVIFALEFTWQGFSLCLLPFGFICYLGCARLSLYWDNQQAIAWHDLVARQSAIR